MFHQSILENLLYYRQIARHFELICLLLIIFTISSCYSIPITTLSSSTYNRLELISNITYRNLILRQHFIDLLNLSHSELVRSMITNHNSTTKVKQITHRKRRYASYLSSSSKPMLTIESKHCFQLTPTKIQSTFDFPHKIQSASSIELIYRLNSNENKPLSIPIHITIKQSNILNEFYSINTYLQYDSNRDFYFLNIYHYILKFNNENLLIETTISNQTCEGSHAYICISSTRSNEILISDKSQSMTCKLKTVKANFDDLGLASVIIRPKEYIFTYCDGTCSNMNFGQQRKHFSLYSMIKSLSGKINSNISQLNCVPTQFESANFLVRQPDENIEIYPIKNALVKECACL